MSDHAFDEFAPASTSSDALRQDGRTEALEGLPAAARYGLSLLLVVTATVIALGASRVVGPDSLALIFVVPVVVAAAAFGWFPALAAVAASVLAFDFFFTEPRLSLAIDDPSDIWATVLLLLIATVVSAVAAQSRQRALQAARAADNAHALQGLAHAVIGARPESEILEAAAGAIHRVFRAPAVIFLERDGVVRAAASAGSPQVTDDDEAAARWSLASHAPARAESYPNDKSEFDFWPVTSQAGRACVIGVDFARGAAERPASLKDIVEIVAAYLAVALDRTRPSEAR